MSRLAATCWKPSAALLGAACITVAFCLLVPMLGTTWRAPIILKSDPVPVVIMPRETRRRVDQSAGGQSASSATAQSPSLSAPPLSLPTIPAPSDMALPAPSPLTSLSLSAPDGPQGTPDGPGGTGFDQPPRVLTRLDPYYPEAARRSGTQGSVTVRVLVDEYGRVTEAGVVQSEPAGVFDAAALKAVRGWRFSPAQRMGHPVAVRIDIPIRFSLDR